jgi:hypothetical protein
VLVLESSVIFVDGTEIGVKLSFSSLCSSQCGQYDFGTSYIGLRIRGKSFYPRHRYVTFFLLRGTFMVHRSALVRVKIWSFFVLANAWP